MQRNKRDETLKNSLTISCFVCAAGSFGAFFRWLQNMLSFEKDTVNYLMLPTAWPIVMTLYSIGVAVLFAMLIRNLYKKGYSSPPDMRSAFRCRNFLLPIAAWVIGGLMIIGGIVTIIEIEPTDNGELLTFIGLLAMISGLSFPGVCTSSLRKFSPSLVFMFMLFPVLLFCVWLIYCYTVNSTIPEVWVYAVEVVAISSAIFAFLFNLGYPAGRTRPKLAMFFSMLASFFCFMTLSDERSTGLTLLLIATALMLLLENWIIISNMGHPRKAEKTEAKPEPEPEPEIELDLDLGLDEVIPAGGSTKSEPTIEFFDDDVKEWTGSKNKH